MSANCRTLFKWFLSLLFAYSLKDTKQALTDSCNGLKSRVDSTREAAEQVKKKLADLEKQLQQEQAAHADALSELKQHEADALEHLKEQMQLEHDRSMLQAEKSFHAQLQQLKAENQTEIDKYQKKYFDLLEQMQNQDKHSWIGPKPPPLLWNPTDLRRWKGIAPPYPQKEGEKSSRQRGRGRSRFPAQNQEFFEIGIDFAFLVELVIVVSSQIAEGESILNTTL